MSQHRETGETPQREASPVPQAAPPAPPAPITTTFGPAQEAPRAADNHPKRPRKGKAWALVLTGVVLFCGGGVTGAVLTDPTGSEEYAALEASKQAVESALAGIESDYEVLQDDYDVMADGMRDREVDVEKRETAAGAAEDKVKAAEAAVKAREDAVTGAEKTKADNTVGDGTWVVGTDIEPGTYRAVQPVGSSCYWGIYSSGSNGSDIIDNDLPGGGHPTVTLAEGQDFKSSRCGTWEKQ